MRFLLRANAADFSAFFFLIHFFHAPAQGRVLAGRGVSLEDLHRPGSGTQWKSWICCGEGVGSAELCRGRQVAGAAQWEDECGRMEGEVAK